MPRRRRNLRWLWGLVFLVVIMGAVVAIVMVVNSNKTSSDDTGSKTEVVESGNSEKEVKGNDAGKKDVQQYDGESPNVSETLTGVVSYADVIEDNLIIRTNINQFIDSGNCALTISKNGINYYTQTTSIVESVTTSTCDGFKIPVAELTQGDLQIEILLESGDKNGKIVGKVRI